jgi:hypothetical protein
VVIDQPEPAGSLLQIGFHTLSGETGRQALAQVVWCRPRGDGRYSLGLSLVARGDRRQRRPRGGLDGPEASEPTHSEG